MDGHGSRKPQAAEKNPVFHNGVCVLDLLIVMETLTRSCCSSLTCSRAVRGAGRDQTALLQSPGVLRGGDPSSLGVSPPYLGCDGV